MLSASQSGLDSPSHFGDSSKIEGTAKVGGVVIPDAQLLFSGDFKRAGLDLALQLPFRKISESMGNHDSKIVDAGSVD